MGLTGAASPALELKLLGLAFFLWLLGIKFSSTYLAQYFFLTNCIIFLTLRTL